MISDICKTSSPKPTSRRKQFLKHCVVLCVVTMEKVLINICDRIRVSAFLFLTSSTLTLAFPILVSFSGLEVDQNLFQLSYRISYHLHILITLNLKPTIQEILFCLLNILRRNCFQQTITACYRTTTRSNAALFLSLMWYLPLSLK